MADMLVKGDAKVGLKEAEKADEDMEDDAGMAGAIVWALYSRKGGRKQWWPARVSLGLYLPPSLFPSTSPHPPLSLLCRTNHASTALRLTLGATSWSTRPRPACRTTSSR
jgi:hypothetical protein